MYTAQGTLEKERLVTQYAPLVKRIAYHLMAKLPASVQFVDLIKNGMIGLLDALGRFEEGMGAQFETYAVQRIRGSMLDGLRENDWLPRGLRKEMRRVEAAILKLEHENGRQPSEGELASALDMTLSDYQRLLLDARGPAGRVAQAVPGLAGLPAGAERLGALSPALIDGLLMALQRSEARALRRCVARYEPAEATAP
jgi:RNA polymerase sigma factor (sigma-70 family)